MTPWEHEARDAHNSNWERGEIQPDCIEMGLEAPRGNAAINLRRRLRRQGTPALTKAWLAGRDFAFADNCMIPCEKRLGLICMDRCAPATARTSQNVSGEQACPFKECHSGLHNRRGPR